MDARAFVAELDAANQEMLARLEPTDTLEKDALGRLDITHLLKMALKSELEATEIAARWLATTKDLQVKLALARQVGDEAKHYRLIEDRLAELHVDLREFDPVAAGYTPLFQYLDSLTDTVERVAAGQFTREAIATVKNRQFIELCEAKGDAATAALYRDTIQPDEEFHHLLGRQLLLRLATTPEAQDRARRAAGKTLAIAAELQRLLREKSGVHHGPGC
ncbi:MAG: ferritin-like domain-containing protein [Candidatus Tectomicrobia bacterium]|nr:ferritin-like domain-containing protein [Candidatus Tectomicrobia bacterium]